MAAWQLRSLCIAGGLLCLAAPAPADDSYLVLLDRAGAAEYRAAADVMSAAHAGQVRVADFDQTQELLEHMRATRPRRVVFVLGPERIDVERTRRMLELSTQVDDDLFVDFEYAFVTGRDGRAAERFARRCVGEAPGAVASASSPASAPARRGAIFGSWEGAMLPLNQPLSATKALGFAFEQHYVKTADAPAAQATAARGALAQLGGKDILLFFSHGYPDQMVSCFRAPDLRAANVDLAPAVLINCACYNGAPGRWWEVSPRGARDRGVVAADDSVALQLLDSGIRAYFAGIDPWHGPLANQVFYCLTDDGLSVGAAAKRMHDRLALEFAPERIHYKPVKDYRFTGEGRANRRSNGAGMIVYGDPAHVPFARRGARLTRDTISESDGKLHVTIVMQPLIGGPPGADFMLPQARLTDYYSVRSNDVMKELKIEVYRVVDLPTPRTAPPALRVSSAKSAALELPAGTPQIALETTHDGQRLHVRIPIDVGVFGDMRTLQIALQGLQIELTE